MRNRMWFGVACFLVVGLLVLAMTAQAAPPAQDPAVGDIGPDTPLKASVSGTAINWGYRSEPGLHVTLTGAGWMLETITASDGRFSFDNLGEGVALLNPVLPEESSFHPMTVDLAVPFSGPVNRTVNLGIHGGEQYPAGLPVSINMIPSSMQVGPSETVTFTVVVSNNMPNDIHQVFVTDMFPEELRPVDIESTVGSAWIGGQAAIADLGDIAQDEGAVVTIVAIMGPNVDPDDVVNNRAGVFYRESVALQSEVNLNEEIIDEPDTLPETGAQVALPIGAAVVLLGAIVGLRRLRLVHLG